MSPTGLHFFETSGTLAGLTRGTTAGHIARDALEGIAFQVADVPTATPTNTPFQFLDITAGSFTSRAYRVWLGPLSFPRYQL